jgi:DNA end-binding protein Ku
MAATVWKGYLSFGLISVPIRLFAAARPERIRFHMLHKVCGTRIRQQLFCPSCERVVERSEIVKGYQVSKDTYAEIDPEELKKIAPPSARVMEILQFVRIHDVDPLYFESSFYALPEEAGQKAYYLLVKTLETSGYAAVAKVAMHNREHVVIIRPRDQGLTVHTLYYPNELHQLSEYGRPPEVELSPREVELAQRLVENLAGPFEPEKFEDEYQKRVLQLIETKLQGKPVRAEKPQRMAPVIDLMEALQRSLAAADRKPPGRAGKERPAAEKPPRKRPERKRAAG